MVPGVATANPAIARPPFLRNRRLADLDLLIGRCGFIAWIAGKFRPKPGSRKLAGMDSLLLRPGICCWLMIQAALAGAAVAGPAPGSFDFAHIDLSMAYFGAPSDGMIEEISQTAAAAHLKRHSDRTGYFPKDATAQDITRALLTEVPSEEKIQAVLALKESVAGNSAMQEACMATAAAFLPDGATPANPLHITWGYDIGVAMDAHASLNLTHPHFLADPQEVWFYCTHEAHHSGLMQVHPMPLISDIDTVAELYDFVRYATFLEGLAVHAARESRSRYEALGADPDYVALEDETVLEAFMVRYWNRLDWLESEIGQPLGDSHWQVVEALSSGDRLWYVVGAAMAAAIENSLGRQGLLDVELRGADAFYEAFRQTVRVER